jgi:hypothetical protein
MSFQTASSSTTGTNKFGERLVVDRLKCGSIWGESEKHGNVGRGTYDSRAAISCRKLREYTCSDILDGHWQLSPARMKYEGMWAVALNFSDMMG